MNETLHIAKEIIALLTGAGGFAVVVCITLLAGVYLLMMGAKTALNIHAETMSQFSKALERINDSLHEIDTSLKTVVKNTTGSPYRIKSKNGSHS
jgi:hypothetical protein